MKTNFTPGPSQLYFTLENHVRAALRLNIGSISHRSKTFEKIYQETTEGLKELLSLPADCNIFFTASATEIWERSIQNLVGHRSHHLVNGSFSKRFHETALQLGKETSSSVVPDGKGFKSLQIPDGTELIAVTHNETSTGVSLPLEFIHSIKTNHPQALVVVDAVSSLPYPNFDFSAIDSLFFSVQKGFGLPAGLGVWITNDRCLQKAEQLQKEGYTIGSYHSLLSLRSHQVKNQTPETPNVLAIYLLRCIVQDFLHRGINTIRKETEYKAALLYQALTQHPLLNPFVKEPEWQSRTVIVADCGVHTEAVATNLQQHGLYPGDGYGANKKTQLRFANFPTHSKEQYELLVDTLATTLK